MRIDAVPRREERSVGDVDASRAESLAARVDTRDARIGPEPARTVHVRREHREVVWSPGAIAQRDDVTVIPNWLTTRVQRSHIGGASREKNARRGLHAGDDILTVAWSHAICDSPTAPRRRGHRTVGRVEVRAISHQ